MSPARLRVVGLGPGDPRYLTASADAALRGARTARLRTRVHPAAALYAVESYDDWYESADSFDELYERIVDDLVALAVASPDEDVVYAVPGSPVVAERTVELLRERGEIEVVVEPAVSVIDVACAALGVDPMARGLRVLDALGTTEPFRGPGPLLILQTYAPEVLATVADRLAPATEVDVVHHLGLDDQRIVRLRARDLASFADADHLTSVYVDTLRTAGDAMDDLVALAHELRARCPWDQEQTHRSLTRYLVEESYEALDALSNLAAMIETGDDDQVLVAHAEEELGDLLFQVVFHAELAEEEGRFTLASIADAERRKLIGRHPHVFGDLVVERASDVEGLWEQWKQAEKGRESVLDGIAWQLPSLSLHAKVLRKARRLGLEPAATTTAASDLEHLLDATADSTEEASAAARRLVNALSGAAATRGIDLEELLRAEVLALRDQILAIEARDREGRDVAK